MTSLSPIAGDRSSLWTRILQELELDCPPPARRPKRSSETLVALPIGPLPEGLDLQREQLDRPELAL
jgi:hypothetical protein